MERAQLLQKVKEIQARWSAELGEVTDIWLPPELLDILDPRHLVERVQAPLRIGETYITPFTPLHKNQIRVAFLTEVDFESTEEEHIDASVSPDGPTSSGE